MTCVFAFIAILSLAQGSKDAKYFQISVLTTSLPFGSMKCVSITFDSLYIKIRDCHPNSHATAYSVLTKFQQDSLLAFINTFPFKKLKDTYVNDKVDCGVLYSIQIKIDKFTKSVFVSNKYDEQLGKLIEQINKYVPKNLWIYYKKEIWDIHE